MQMNQRTISNLKGVHPSLVKLITEAFKTTPIKFSVICGVRSAKDQAIAFKTGKSKCDGIKIKSPHQVKADGYGHAVDAYPIPIDYKDTKRFKILAEHIKSTAKKLGIKIRWGGEFKTLVDLPHYELA